MFLRMASIGTKYVADAILSGDGSVTPSDIRTNFALQGTVPQVFTILDVNHDGTVTLGELSRSNNFSDTRTGNLPAVQDVIGLMLQEMALGAGNEQFTSLGVKLTDLPRRLCNGAQGEDESDFPKVCPIFPEPPASKQPDR